MRALIVLAVAAASSTVPAGAQEPQPPVPVPRPLIMESPDQRGDVPVATRLQQPGPEEPPDKFVPLDELPPEEQLPAAPLLVSAYAFVLLALFAYVLSIARRLGAVQQEVERLERDLKKSGRA